MQMGTETAITSHAILLLTWSCITSASILTDIPKDNPLNIDWYPAPSPEDGPPLSRGASRDKALLPAQIGGILGAYLFAVCIVGIFLICIGRRLREKLSNPGKSDIEMVLTPFHKNFINFNQTPTTAAYPGSATQRNFSWPSPEKDTRNPYIFPSANRSPITPTSPKLPHVDTRIVEADREMLQRDLEDIYAHVMEQEEAKAAGVKVAEMPLPPQLQRVGLPPRPVMSPTYKNDKARPGALNIEEAKPQSKAASRASSIISSLKSPRLGRRKSVKTMQISSPILTPMSGTFPRDSGASDEEPLSPRYYNPPPPPPVPTDQYPYNHSRNASSIGPASPTRSIAEQINSTGRTLTSPRHHPNQSQTSVQSHASSMRGEQPASATSQTPLFLPPPSRKQTSPAPAAKSQSNNNSTRTLPFRQFEPALASPSFTGSTKTTVLERHDRNNGPMTGGLRTPWSAGAVPYSPYQPFSPMIPITPRLVTKEDRKAMKKVQPKTPTLDLIQDEKDIWDSGY